MLRRLINSVIETTVNHTPETISYPTSFTRKETLHFEWLSTAAPCFPVNADKITIIKQPQDFYNALLTNCQSANQRITLVSLYLGNGKLEKNLVETVMNNRAFRANKLKVNVLLDYTRGSRLPNDSRTILQPLLLQQNCSVSLYHTPALRGLLKKLIPNRWNELLGLQHMKLYIFDNTLIISGANLSNDYFTNRQDRYFMIQDKRLCDFYCGLVERVQRFSLSMDSNNELSLQPNWKQSPYEGDSDKFVQAAGDLVEQYLESAIDEENSHKRDGYDTWIFPAVQMGQLGIEQDAEITNQIFAKAPANSKLQIATGYFNLTSQYMNTLVEQCKGCCNILMAHPTANGFLGAKGPAGGIPFAYSYIAHLFSRKFQQTNRINLLEYSRRDWTYHAKGLWYYAPQEKYPSLTLIGSPNFGHRSVSKDLETQLVVVTENEQLRKQLHEECEALYDLGAPAETSRPVPVWVKVMVGLFRNYF